MVAVWLAVGQLEPAAVGVVLAVVLAVEATIVEVVAPTMEGTQATLGSVLWSLVPCKSIPLMSVTTNSIAVTEKVLNGHGYPRYLQHVRFLKPAADTVVVGGKVLSLCPVRPVAVGQGPVPAVSIVALHQEAVDQDHIPEVVQAAGGVCGEYLLVQHQVKNTLSQKVKV